MGAPVDARPMAYRPLAERLADCEMHIRRGRAVQRACEKQGLTHEAECAGFWVDELLLVWVRLRTLAK